MKKISLFFLAAILASALLNSCSTSNDVVSNHRIQKRKYNKGFFIEKRTEKGKFKKSLKNEDFLVKINPKEEVAHKNTLNIEQPHFKSLDFVSPEVTAKSNIEHTETAFITQQKIKKSKKSEVSAQEILVAERTVSQSNFKPEKIKQKIIKRASRKLNTDDEEIEPILLYLLCFVIPPVAVGLVTDWNTNDVILNIILTCLCGLPGIIHALIVVSKNVSA